MHVESGDEGPSDAGSTPAASTNFPRKSANSTSFSRRLHYSSTRQPQSRFIKQPNRTLDGGGTQVHVPLSRREILMASQFLNRPRRRSPHRQMRAERVTQDVHPQPFHACPPLSPPHAILNHFLSQAIAAFVV